LSPNFFFSKLRCKRDFHWRQCRQSRQARFRTGYLPKKKEYKLSRLLLLHISLILDYPFHKGSPKKARKVGSPNKDTSSTASGSANTVVSASLPTGTPKKEALNPKKQASTTSISTASPKVSEDEV
jgi:hypothetical protein